MANIKPFKALRYNEQKGNIKDFICPAYDIVRESEYNLLNENKINMIQLELPRGNNAYENARIKLDEWKESGILKQDNEDSFYIYEEDFICKGQEYTLKGFIGKLKLSKFKDRVVIPHEETLSKPKEDRLNLMKSTSCNFSPIYCLYMDEKGNEKLINELSKRQADVSTVDKIGTVHKLWKISDEKSIHKITYNMSDECLYIADGHHRYETALNYMDYCKDNGIKHQDDKEKYVMTMFVSMENTGLVVLPTHRMVKNIEEFNAEKILYQAKKYFHVKENIKTNNIEKELLASYNNNQKSIIFYAGNNKTYLLTLKDTKEIDNMNCHMSKASKRLDVNILHTVILDKIMGIDKDKLAKQSNIAYTRDINEAIKSVDNGTSQCAFMINPTSVSDIKAVSDEGEKMPQKSTYFYPKLITGLVINEM